MAQEDGKQPSVNTWSRNASLLIAEASNNEAAASLQAVRRLFTPWEQQLMEAPGNLAASRPLATLISLRELLTRFYHVRYEFDQASPPPEALPLQMPEELDFASLRDDDGEYCIALIKPLPGLWLHAAEQKFIIQPHHCQELDALFQQFFNVDRVRDAVQQQSSTLKSIEVNLGYDTAIKAFRDDGLRKTLAPLAAKKTLDSNAFREMLAQQRKNYDNLTIDGGQQKFSVEGCSFRNAHFQNITLELEGCALHHTSYGKNTLLRLAHDCEFGKQVKSLAIDCLRGDYSSTHFDHSRIKIIYPGCQLGHISHSHIGEFGGNVKHLDRCRVGTLRGICLRVTDSRIDRAVRARFGSRLSGLNCGEMSSCQFGSRELEGIKAVGTLRGNSASDLTFVNTAIDSIHADAVLFRLRGCAVKHLHGTVATLERCRIGRIHNGAQVNEVITSEIDVLGGGTIKLCGTHQEHDPEPSQADDHPAKGRAAKQQRTLIREMSSGAIDHLNGLIKQFTGGRVVRLGFEKELRLSTVRCFIQQWRGGQVGGLEKAEFLIREKEMLRQETIVIAKAIRKRSSAARARKKQVTAALATTTRPASKKAAAKQPPAATQPVPKKANDVKTNGYKTIKFAP